MKKPHQTKVDPASIFSHAHRFNQAYKVLMPVQGPSQYGPGDETLAQPAAVVSALSSELFLKCLICLETGSVPRGHHLKHLFDSLSPKTRNRILDLWNTVVVPIRLQQWNMLDPSDRPPMHLVSDLTAALVAGNQTFETVRYSYEGNLENFAFVFSELPVLLSTVAIELKPEFEALHPRNQKRPTSQNR